MPLHLPTLKSPTPTPNPSYKINGLQFMNDEAELFDAINKFNSAYMNYAACQNNQDSGFGETDICDDSEMMDSYLRILNLDTNMSKNWDDPENPDAAIHFYDANQSNYFKDKLINKDVYKSNHKYILDTYHKNILKIRNDLDVKLNQLYETNGAFLSDYKMDFDGSIYTGILWTILATSIIYYVFTRE